MGSYARIYIFDHGAYEQIVVPAFHKLLLDGSFAPWLKELYTKILDFEITNSEEFKLLEKIQGVDIQRNCHYLNSDFSYKESGKDWWESGWEFRVCTSLICPDRHSCPFHESHKWLTAEELNFFFEYAVVDKCLGPCLFMGKSIGPTCYRETLSELGCSPEHEIYEFLNFLEYRGFVIGYRWGNSDGIHGWLTPIETLRMVEILESLNLPFIERNFTALERISSKFSGMEASLAQLRTFGSMALDQNKGILWGNSIEITY